MVRPRLVLAAAAVATLAFPPASSTGSRPEIPVVVALRGIPEAARTPAARADVRTLQDAVLGRLGPGFELTARWSAVPGFAGLVTRAGLRKLESDPNVLRVDRDVPGGAADDVSLAAIHGDAAHAAGLTGGGVTVAVLDTGIDAANPDFAGRIVAQHCFCRHADGTPCCPGGTSEADGPGSASDDNGHGTWVTGVLAGGGAVAPVGVAPAARIVAVKVADSQGRFDFSSQLVSGLDWILSARPDVRVVNLSQGTDRLFSGICDDSSAFTLAFASAIRALRERGTLVFASSGNDGSRFSMQLPACIGSTVAVAATYDAALGPLTFFGCTDATTAPDTVTCFSDSSPALDLLAPGAVIRTSAIGGRTAVVTGTSFACPQAAGAAALVAGAVPTVSADALEAALEAGPRVTDPRNGLARPRVDVLAALARARSPLPPGPPSLATGVTAVSFGAVRLRRTKAALVTIRNGGELDLHVIATTSGGAFSVAPATATVPAGTPVALRVVFRPPRAGAYSGALVLASDDPEHRRVELRLRGRGVRR